MAKNLKLTTDKKELEKNFTIFNNDLGFIQPGYSKYIPIGSLSMTIAANYLAIFDNIIKQDDLDTISFFLEYNNKRKKIDLNFNYVLKMPHTPLGKTLEEMVEERQVKQMEVINKNISSISSSLSSIDKKLKK